MTDAPDGTLLLTRSDVERLLDARTCIDAVEAAFRARAEGLPSPSGVLGIHLSGGGLHAKGAALALARPVAAVKVNANFPSNPARHGLPTIQGVLTLFDATDGRVLAVIDSMSITTLRTAAATAVAAKYLATVGAETLTIVGCGAQSLPHVVAMAAVRPVRRVVAFDTNAERAGRLCAAAIATLGVEARVAASLKDATHESAVVVTTTPARAAFLERRHLAAGAFVAAVGADSENKHEIAPALMAESAVVVDDLDQCCAIGDLHHAIASGVMQAASVRASLGDVVVDPSRGRRSNDEIVIFDSTGVAIEDVAAAAVTYERALAAGIGHRVRLDR